MKIGRARVCITPKQPFHLIGYRSDNRYACASGVHDDIFANAVLFEKEAQVVFLFSADVLEFEESMAEEVKTLLQERFGIERDNVLLCATHNHSSCVSYHKSWYTNKFDQAYYDWFIEAIVNCYAQCLENKKEAVARFGKQQVLGYYGNRNHPGECADNEVIVVKFYDVHGIPFAGIVNWAVHSTVISAENTYLTSELAGEVSKKLYTRFGFYPAMMVGAAGDCSNRNERQGNDFAELKRVSDALANVIGDISCEQPISLTTIKSINLVHTIHHDMSFVHDELHIELKKMQQEANSANNMQRKQIEKRMNNLRIKLQQHSFHLDAKGSVISLGGIHIFVFPGELGSAFGIQMKKACEQLGLICGYTNGYYEYFMPKEEYGLSFETIASPIPKGEAEQMIQKYIQASTALSREQENV